MRRREFLGLAAAGAGLLLAGCSVNSAGEPGDESARGAEASGAEAFPATDPDAMPPLPSAEPDTESPFLVDKNINMDTIDDWLGREDVAYRDMRLVRDPADYAAIGGDADLSFVLEGFKVTPFPLIGTLQELPVEGAYTGDRLFDIRWSDEGTVAAVTPRYEESMQIIEELFPRDRAVFLMCGGAGYASMMRQLLLYLGWDASRLYNVGGAWDYTGYHPVEIAHSDGDNTRWYLWRADIADFGLEHLHPVEA